MTNATINIDGPLNISVSGGAKESAIIWVLSVLAIVCAIKYLFTGILW